MQFTLKGDARKRIANLQATLNAFPDTIRQVARTAADATESRVLDILDETPGRVRYPIEWTSEKQRRAFFATNGFGKGIPYKRTGAMNRSWIVSDAPALNGAVIFARNTSPYAKYVIGQFTQRSPMQKFHMNTGWQPLQLKRQQIFSIWIDAVKQAISDEVANASI